MADDLDRASDLEQLQRDLALQRHASKSGAGAPSRNYCIECREPIPPRRRSLGGITHCFDCAYINELKAARIRRR